MNNSRESTIGMALMCDPDGVILGVLHNVMGIAETDVVGKPFPLIVTRSDFHKALAFIVELKSKRMAFDWELDLSVNGDVVLAHCAGLVFQANVLIMVAQARFAVHHFFEEMMRISNDHANLSRSAVKERFQIGSGQPQDRIGSYDQLSQMNNELVTLHRDLAKKAERDHHIASVLQRALLPSQMPVLPQGYEIAAKYLPAMDEAEICGDFYDLFDLGRGKIGIVIGDIVGKGLKAAVRVAAVIHTLRSYAFQDDRPSKVMALTHDALFRDRVAEREMLTAFFSVLDTRVGRLTYTSAGHEPPLLRHSDGSIEYLTTGGPMLTGIEQIDYREGCVDLQAGDVVVMLTDGITEARKSGRFELFGADGVARSLSSHAGASTEEIATGLLEDASSFAEGFLNDDIAVVVIKKLGDVT
jgi:serine phosphatase RsbU (regulator of sigma subunit)